MLKDLRGRTVNSVEMPHFTYAKELQLHVMEVKPNSPFGSPVEFEETMQEAVRTLFDFVNRMYGAQLLGTGMHPLLRLDETGIWPHRHRQIYQAYGRVFTMKRHGWLNIQSYQLNLPYSGEKDGVMLHNLLANLCVYLPAIAASSPIYEGKIGEDLDNRLRFYRENQREIPSVTGSVVPEQTTSLEQYQRQIIGKYSEDLAKAGAGRLLFGKDWVNSRGVIFRFDRRALEIRVMDEQECIKSDVALSCFIRALLRGWIAKGVDLVPHEILLKDFNLVVRDGREARVNSLNGKAARDVCRRFYRTAFEAATSEERKYLQLVENRIEKGSLSELLRTRLQRKSRKTDLEDAIVDTYLQLAESLIENQPYF